MFGCSGSDDVVVVDVIVVSVVVIAVFVVVVVVVVVVILVVVDRNKVMNIATTVTVASK